jgi:hypothetical protein
MPVEHLPGKASHGHGLGLFHAPDVKRVEQPALAIQEFQYDIPRADGMDRELVRAQPCHRRRRKPDPEHPARCRSSPEQMVGIGNSNAGAKRLTLLIAKPNARRR